MDVIEYGFDEKIERKGTNCYKWDAAEKVFGGEVLPLWVADMDFAVPANIRRTLMERVMHPVYGYTFMESEEFKPFTDWAAKRYGITVEKKHIVNTPGIVNAIAMAINAFTDEGDEIIVQTPVYPPFFKTAKQNNRVVVENRLKFNDGFYEMDFEDFEEKLKREKVKLFILCNPHNPVGRVWKKEDLARISELCMKYGVKIFSDEIHADIIFKGIRFNSMLSAAKSFDNIIVAFAPSKTFNVAGLYFSIIVIPDEKMRETFKGQIEKFHIPAVNAFNGSTAMSAYREGEEWVEEMLSYVEGNADYVVDFMEKNMPFVGVWPRLM